MFCTKPLKLFLFSGFGFCGVTLSLCQVSSPRCSPRQTPALVFGCLVPPHPKSHCTDTSVLPPAGAASASLQPRFFQASPCLQPSLCRVCAVLLVPGEFLPSLLLVWPRWGCAEPGDQPSSCLHGHSTRAQQGQWAKPSPIPGPLEGGEWSRSPARLQSRDFESWNHIL